MDYQSAKEIRGRSLTSLITSRMVSGRGVGSAISKSVSLKMRAKVTGIKEKFDPMNIARFMTGGSRFATAAVGRLTGRSTKDIEYFAGSKKKYSRMNRPVKTSEKLNATSIGTLSDMLTFFQLVDKRDSKRRELDRAFAEEKEMEGERRHKNFLSVLKNFIDSVSTQTRAIPEKEEKKDGIMSGLLPILSSMFGAFKSLISTLSSLLTTFILPLIKSLISSIVSSILSGVRFLISKLLKGVLQALSWISKLRFLPLFRLLLRAAGPIALGYMLYELVKLAAEKIPNYKYLTPQGALGLLKGATSLRDFADKGGYEAVAEMAKAKPKAIAALYRYYEDPEDFENKFKIRQMGGLDNVRKIAEEPDINEAEIPSLEEIIKRTLTSMKDPYIDMSQFKGVQRTQFLEKYRESGVRRDLDEEDVLQEVDLRKAIDYYKKNYDYEVPQMDYGSASPESLTTLENSIGAFAPLTDLEKENMRLNEEMRMSYAHSVHSRASPPIATTTRTLSTTDEQSQVADTRNRDKIFTNAIRRNLAPL
jgi:hypothetical protein